MLTRHENIPGQVVWVPIRDGLGQVVNSHLVFLARINHEVVKGKIPLKKREKGTLEESHISLCHPHLCAKNLIAISSPQINQNENKATTTTESAIGTQYLYPVSSALPAFFPSPLDNLDLASLVESTVTCKAG